MNMNCPQCKQLLGIPDGIPQVQCPFCKTVFATTAPAPAPAPAAAPQSFPPNPAPQAPYQQQPPYQQMPPKKSSSPVALILGIVLLVVLLVIGGGAALLLPALSSAREKARRINCATNLKQIGTALKCYTVDSDSYFPDKDIQGTLVKNDYLTDETVWVCPTSGKPYAYFCEGFIEGYEIADVPAVVCNGHDGEFVNVLFGGGYVQGFNIKNLKSFESIISHVLVGDYTKRTKWGELVFKRARTMDGR